MATKISRTLDKQHFTSEWRVRQLVIPDDFQQSSLFLCVIRQLSERT